MTDMPLSNSSNALSNLSNALAGAVQSAGASLVRVDARRRLPATGVIWSADGLIVTSNHVVERDDNIQVGLPDGRDVSATIVGRDPRTDVAILKADATGLTVPTWIEANDLQVGHLVLAVGRPGSQPMATMGIVSALSSDAWRTPAGGNLDRYLQTDVLMYPGFSGGALVTADGKVAGINSSSLMQGVSLTIPTGTLKRVADSLLTHGKMRQGYLGVGSQPVRLPDALAQSSGQQIGLMLVSVEPGSPADKGGLVLGDVLLKADDTVLDGMDALLGYLAGDRVGNTTQFHISRGGQTQTVAVTIGER